MKKLISTLLLILLAVPGALAQSFSFVGTGTGSNTSTSYPAPFGNYYYGARHQFFITAAQLTAAGVPAGAQIVSLGFNVTATNGAGVHQNFQIKVFTTTATNPLSSGWVTTGMVAQTNPVNHTPVTGWNQFTFVSPFTWNGTDNLVVETCFNNASWVANASTQWTNSGLTPAGTTWSRWYRADVSGVCTSTSLTSTSTTTRPNMRIEWQTATPCSGTPSPGATTASPTTACPSQSINLGLSTPPSGTGLTYQWQRSTDGGATWTNFGTSSPTQTTTLSPFVTTQFRCIVTCTNSGQSGTSTPVTVNPGNSCQCASYGASSATWAFDGEITNVTVGTMNNPSNCTTPAPGPGSALQLYSNFTTSVAGPSADQGSNVNFSVTVGTCGGTYGHHMKIFIDWNQDGDFVDAGETVYTTSATVFPTTTVSGSFTVPMSASVGTTRMRVVLMETTDPNSVLPTGTYAYGETEDYCFTVTTPPPCTGTPNPGNTTASLSSACNGQNVTLNFSGTVTGAGLTYNWEYSTDGGTTWTTFSTNPPPVTYTFGTQTTQFRCTVTCTNSGQSGTSTPVTVTAGGACECASYCTPTVTWGACGFMWTSNVTTTGGLTNFTHNSACSTGGYGNFGGTYSCSQYPGSTVNISMTSSNYAMNYRVFIDWNNDGDFLDVDEQAVSINNSSGLFTVSGVITVPGWATPGTYRMRVIGDYYFSAMPSSCGPIDYGETEDYCFTVATPPACSGTPAPGNTTSSASVGCNGQNITLNFSGTVVGTGLTYNWEYSTDGGTTWTTFSTNPPPVTYTFGTQTTEFRCTVTCTNSGQSGTSTPVTVTAGGPCQCASYGSSSATTAFDGEITNVTVGTMNNPSNCTTPAPGPGSVLGMYSNFTTSVAGPSADQGSNVSFNITVGTCGGNYPHHIKIFIDWNQDGDWLDAGEEVAATATTLYPPNNFTGSFTVPMSAALGSTRMRIIMSEEYGANNITPTYSYTYGETEDYCFTVTTPPPCTGTPNPGNTTASLSSACNGQNVTLNFTGTVTGTGLTYNWEYSTDGGTTWTSFSTSAPPVTYTFGTQTTQFRCTVTCTNSGQSGTSTPVTVTAGSACQCSSYCSPVTNCSSLDHIQNVTLLDGSTPLINNTTSCNNATTGFTLFTSPNPTLMQGSTYSLSVTTSSSWSQGLRVWFDWNGDGDFADTGEEITLSPSNYVGTAPATYTATVVVPMSAVPGSTRMRAKCNYAGAPPVDPCANTTFGETEDYCITIAVPPPCSGTPAPGNTTANTTVGCNGQNITLNFSGTVTGTGLTYDWQYSTDGGATWTSFSTSAPPVTYTYGTAPVTQFRCVVTCTNSGQSGTSTPVTVTLGSSCVCASYAGVTNILSGWGDITNVTLGSFSNSSACAATAPGPGSIPNQYSNYTTIAGPLFVTGSTVNFGIQVTNCTGGTYDYHVNVYVDWNADGDFVDAGEAVYVSSAPIAVPAGSPQTFSGSFVVPVSATLGNTRLRVITKEITVNDITPSGPMNSWGEVEDYCVTVAPPTCTWTGAVPAGPVWGSWHVAGNWDCGYVPTITTDVVIPNTAPVMPAIGIADGNARNVTMQNGTQIFIVSSNRRLNVANDWSAGTGTGAAVNYGPGSVRMLASDGLGEMTGNTGFHTLDIHAGTGTVTITSGSVRVRNAVQLRSGTLNTLGNLTLESLLSPAHTAGIIDNFSTGFTGTMVGNVKAQRRIPRWNPIFIGSPVNNGTVADIAADVPGGLAHNGIGGDGSNFVADPTCTYMSPSSPWARLMQYDESTVTTCAFNGWQIRLSGTTQNGRGYLLHQVTAASHPTYDFTGIANTGAITANVTRTAANTTANQGVNLLSNPYPSGINLDAFYAANSGVIGTMAYLYNGSTFVTVNMNDGVPSNVASFQGFQVVKSAVGTGTVTFNQSMRVVGNTLAFTDAMAVPHKLEVVVTGRDAEHRDETVVYFGEGLKDGFDLAEDGYKFYSAEGYPTLYTMAEGTAWPVSVNGLNVQTAVTEVPLGLSPGAAGRFVFTVRGGDRLPAGMTCYLVDKVEKKELKVGEETSYVFDINGVETRDRFVLRFRRDVPVEVQPVVQQPQREVKSEEVGVEPDRAWTQNNRIYLSLGRDVPGRLTLRLMDMSGKVVWTDALQNAVRGVYDLGELEVSSGLYILNWSDGRSTQSARLALGLSK